MSDDFALTSPVAVGGRESHDHYPTPRWCTGALLDWLDANDYRRGVEIVFDPCCGEGAILEVVRERWEGTSTRGVELHEGRTSAAIERGLEVVQGDGLDPDLWRFDFFDVAMITNPPYSSAFSWVRCGAEAVGNGDLRFFAALLRLSWLEPTSERRNLLDALPCRILVLPRRPRFDGRGQDSITSAWFVWSPELPPVRPGDLPIESRIVWLPP